MREQPSQMPQWCSLPSPLLPVVACGLLYEVVVSVNVAVASTSYERVSETRVHGLVARVESQQNLPFHLLPYVVNFKIFKV